MFLCIPPLKLEYLINIQLLEINCHGAGTYIKKELIAITDFRQKTGRSLVTTSCWQASSAGNKPDFIFLQFFGSRIVNIPIIQET